MNVLWVDFFQILSRNTDQTKNTGAIGGATFLLYEIQNTFKNLLRNHWVDFIELVRNVPLVNLFQIC